MNNKYLNSPQKLEEIKLEEYTFYIEYRDKIRFWDKKKFIKQHLGLDKPGKGQYRIGSYLYHLCQTEDVQGFDETITIYVNFLDELVPIMMNRVAEKVAEYGFAFDEKEKSFAG